jgi:hypothetical protein
MIRIMIDLTFFKVDTDVTDILLYNSNVNHFGSRRNDFKSKVHTKR